jgi:hypothetical protein
MIAISFALLTNYVWAYAMTVDRAAAAAAFVADDHAPTYRLGAFSLAGMDAFFVPIHAVDKILRREYWNRNGGRVFIHKCRDGSRN